MTTSFALHKKPKYIVNAAVDKYGRNGKIFVLGATQKDIDTFWKHASYAVNPDSLGISPPVEKGKTVVNIEAKTHINDAEKDMEPDLKYEGKQRKPSDWYDDFQITSKKSKGQTKSKSYSLQVGKTTEKQVGINANLKVSTPSFFNVVGGGIGAELGVNASYSKLQGESETEEESKEEKLTQAYEVVDTLKVPPKTKTKVTITTWAVTHESDLKIRVTIDSKAKIIVKYRTRLSQVLGGFSTSTGILTARDIFKNEEDFKDDGVTVTYTSRSTISYVGEEVEIVKEEIPFAAGPPQHKLVASLPPAKPYSI